MIIFEFTALYDYITAVKILKPDLAKLVTTESEKAYVRTKADDLFKKKVEAFMKLANKLAKGMALQQLG
jgi:Na+-transporting methylmalonyl-CoA/oxaloacetate decarboxylase beta subunit